MQSKSKRTKKLQKNNRKIGDQSWIYYLLHFSFKRKKKEKKKKVGLNFNKRGSKKPQLPLH